MAKNPMEELGELGRRVRKERIAEGLKQRELAERSAVAISTVAKLERGKPVTTESLVRVLSALGYPRVLSQALPEPAISPIEMRNLQKWQRQRVR